MIVKKHELKGAKEIRKAEELKTCLINSTVNPNGVIVVKREVPSQGGSSRYEYNTFHFYTPDKELAHVYRLMDKQKFKKNKEGGMRLFNLGWVYDDGSIGKY